jgi:Icc protein
MLIAQLSDTHITLPGELMDVRYKTSEHLARALEHVSRLSKQPDVLWITGDLVDSGQPEEYARLREALKGLSLPTFVIPGNHDERTALRAAFGDHAHLQSGGEFVQFVIEDWPVRMIGLDTLIPGKSGGRLCAQRLAWLDETLAHQPTKPTMLFMHHPPMRTGQLALDGMGFEDPASLGAVLRKYTHVERIVSGHVHRPMTRRFENTVVMTCPSTAHQIALDLATPQLATVMEPPAVLLHQWSPDGGLVTHTSLITSRPALTVYDGTSWENGTPLPPDFYGEIKS